MPHTILDDCKTYTELNKKFVLKTEKYKVAHIQGTGTHGIQIVMKSIDADEEQRFVLEQAEKLSLITKEHEKLSYLYVSFTTHTKVFFIYKEKEVVLENYYEKGKVKYFFDTNFKIEGLEILPIGELHKRSNLDNWMGDVKQRAKNTPETKCLFYQCFKFVAPSILAYIESSDILVSELKQKLKKS